jgi:amino acid transporter
MHTFLLILGTGGGVALGFTLGLFSLMHITKGHNVKQLMQNPKARRYLGLLGWLFAALGGYVGYQFTLAALG